MEDNQPPSLIWTLSCQYSQPTSIIHIGINGGQPAVHSFFLLEGTKKAKNNKIDLQKLTNYDSSQKIHRLKKEETIFDTFTTLQKIKDSQQNMLKLIFYANNKQL